jgi:hypothetical protein
VLTGKAKVYMIYYGNWPAPEKELSDTFVGGLGSSSWYDANNKYYYQANRNAPKVYVNGSTLAGSVVDAYSRGTALAGDDVPKVIEAQIAAGALPTDPEGVYMVALSKDVTEAMRGGKGDKKICTYYCR